MSKQTFEAILKAPIPVKYETEFIFYESEPPRALISPKLRNPCHQATAISVGVPVKALPLEHKIRAPAFGSTLTPGDWSGHYCREETWPKPLGWFASLFAFSSLEDLPTRLRLKPSYSSSGKNTTTKEYYTFSLQELPAQFGQWQGPNVLSTVNQEKQEPLYVRRLLWRRCWLEDRLCICRKIVSGRSLWFQRFRQDNVKSNFPTSLRNLLRSIISSEWAPPLPRPPTRHALSLPIDVRIAREEREREVTVWRSMGIKDGCPSARQSQRE